MIRGCVLFVLGCLGACAATLGEASIGDEPAIMSGLDDTSPVSQARVLVIEAEPGEAARLLEALWQAAEALPHDKRTSLAAPVLELVALSPERDRLDAWETRVGTRAEGARSKPTQYRDAIDDAFDLYAREGEGTFLSRAQAGAPPFNIGRPETLSMVAAETGDDGFATRVLALMFQLADADRGEVAFERPALAHGIAEAAMARCDLANFDRATGMTHSPGSLRYAFWRARITGSAAHLSPLIVAQAETDDTRYVRQALDGYRAILERGYCGAD